MSSLLALAASLFGVDARADEGGGTPPFSSRKADGHIRGGGKQVSEGGGGEASALMAMSLAQLRKLAADEKLDVPLNVGGRKGRTKCDVCRDIARARRGEAPAATRGENPRAVVAQHWQVTDGTDAPWSFGGLPINKLTLGRQTSLPDSFLSTWLPNRVVCHEVDMPTSRAKQEEAMPPPVVVNHDGRTFELVARKIEKDTGGRFFQRKVVRLYYAITSGPGLEPIDLANRLSRFAAFESLPNARKCVSRLELLCSGCYGKGGERRLRADDFELLELSPTADAMADGCGFIGDQALAKLVGVEKLDETVALQVRIVAPRLGVFKGMLMRSQHTDKIQLSPSMRKVPASRLAGGGEEDGWAVLLVKMLHPTAHNGSMAERIGGGTPRSTPMHSKKPLSGMVAMLLSALDVPSEVVKALDAQSRRNDYAADFAWLVGVADPSGCLPEGHVYVTGLPADRLPNARVFVTRSPCVKPEDGRLLPVVCSKPRSMARSSWEWLQTLPFGALIFSTKGRTPLPSLCADGDLDGDLYFACWDTSVLMHVKPREIAKKKKIAKEAVKGENGVLGSPQWLEMAQRHMLDVNALREQKDVCKLFRRWEQCCKGSQAGMDDPDARNYGEAYVEALDHGKHGNGYDMSVLLRN